MQILKFVNRIKINSIHAPYQLNQPCSIEQDPTDVYSVLSED